jgi:tryptophan-rich sensory protein
MLKVGSSSIYLCFILLFLFALLSITFVTFPAKKKKKLFRKLFFIYFAVLQNICCLFSFLFSRNRKILEQELYIQNLLCFSCYVFFMYYQIFVRSFIQLIFCYSKYLSHVGDETKKKMTTTYL